MLHRERNRPLLENDGLLRAEPTTPVNAHAKPPKELREIEPDLLVEYVCVSAAVESRDSYDCYCMSLYSDEATTRDVRQQGDTDAYAGMNDSDHNDMIMIRCYIIMHRLQS